MPEITASDLIEFNRLTDDLARSHNPAGAHERMLVEQIAHAWLRLRRAYAAEQRYFQDRDILETIAAKREEFKTITRYVTDSERAWRHATATLERCQRRRLKASAPQPSTRRSAAPPARAASPGAPHTPQPPVESAATAASTPHRVESVLTATAARRE